MAIKDNFEKIKRVADTVSLITGQDLFKKTRKMETVRARWIVFYICFNVLQYEDITLSMIARYFKLDSHATVINGLKEFEKPQVFLECEKDYHNALAVLEMLKDFDYELIYPKEVKKPKKFSDYKYDIIQKVEDLIDAYEQKIAFYNHDYLKEYPNCFKLFTELSEEDMRLFEETRAKPFVAMRYKKK